MKKFDSRYIIGVFLVLFILIGSVEFILKGHHSFTLNEIYFRVPIVVVGMVERCCQMIKVGERFVCFFSFF